MDRRQFLGLGVMTVAGDGLVRPVGAPPGGNLPIGVQPGVNSAIVIANKVIVFGAGGGVFVYSGTPAKGNPPIAWLSNGTTDPYGNTLPNSAQMGLAGTGTFTAGNTLIKPAGIFTYSGTPATGNLIASTAAVAGTDPFGNAYLGGVAAYGSGGFAVLHNAIAQFGALSAPAGAVGGAVFAPNFTDGSLEVESGLIAASDTLAVTVWQSAQTAAAGVQQVVTDWLVAWQPGQHTITAETWHSMSLLNSWANNVSFAASRYKLMENNSVRVQGVINATAATAATFFTLPAAYRPASAGGAPVGCNAGAGANTVPTLRWDTSGNLTINNLTIPSASAVFFTQDIPLD